MIGIAAPTLAADADTAMADDSGWSFIAASYVWAADLEGQSGVFGFPPQNVDLGFSDILENLDFAFMGVGEARNGRFSLAFDIVYSDVNTNVDTPVGLVFPNGIDVTATNFMGTAAAGYAIFADGKSHLDLVAGARLWYADTEFDFNGAVVLGRTSADDGATWVDPLVGTKFKFALGDNVFLSGCGLVGGFGVSSDFMWDAMAGLGYEVTDSFSAFAGYRALGVDYSNDGFVYDVTQQGPIIAGIFKF